MSTTTIRLPDALKARVTRAAKRAGTTAHNFILEAITEKTAQQDQRDDFHDSAHRRLADIAKSGKTIPWDAVRHYLLLRSADKPVARPTRKTLSD